ncbi:MAG: hypothetical protein L3J01_05980, partial [Thiomicrorhabdus sp.]|nr:hypothetical protein [Thiomicrorhabdus sp.]
MNITQKEQLRAREKSLKKGLNTNHLGNVRAVVSDRRGFTTIAGTTGNYTITNDPELMSWTDYYPFGMRMEGRYGSTEKYKFGFQGQEMDDEIKGEGNSVNYKYRMHDPRIGRFFAVDPLAAQYPHNSPYAFSENRVIDGLELEGLEVFLFHFDVRI